MRIIGYIDHPEMKITVFQSNNRLAIKCESALSEITYKFRMQQKVETLADIRQIFGKSLLEASMDKLKEIQALKTLALKRHLGQENEDGDFPVIL